MRGNFLRLTQPLHVPGIREHCWWDNAHQHMLLLKNDTYYIWRPDGARGTCLYFFRNKAHDASKILLLCKVSLDIQLLVTQISPTRLIVYDVNSSNSWTIDIKSASSNRIIPGGVLWSEHGGGSQDLVLITTRGLEMWKVSPRRKQCKLSRTVSQGLSFHAHYWYEPNFRCVLLASPSKSSTQSSRLLRSLMSAGTSSNRASNKASGTNATTLASLGALTLSGYFLKISKEMLPKLELPPPDKSPDLHLEGSTAESDISLVTIYGQLYIAVRNSLDPLPTLPTHPSQMSYNLDLYLLTHSAVQHTHSLRLGALHEHIQLSVVDNLLITHSLALQSSMIFDIRSTHDSPSASSMVPESKLSDTPGVAIHTVCPAAPIVAHKGCTPRTPNTVLDGAVGGLSDKDLEILYRAPAMPEAEQLRVVFDRSKAHELQLEESKFPEEMESCEYVYHQPEATDQSQLGGRAHDFIFLSPCWVWSESNRCIWKLRACLADIAAISHDPRSVLGFLRRRGQSFSAVRPVYFYSNEKGDAMQAKRLLLHKIGAAVEGKVSMSYLEATFAAITKPYADACRSAREKYKDSSENAEASAIISSTWSTSPQVSAQTSVNGTPRSASNSPRDTSQISTPDSVKSLHDEKTSAVQSPNDEAIDKVKTQEPRDALSSIFSIGNAVTHLMEATQASLAAYVQQRDSYTSESMPVRDLLPLEPLDALHMLLSDISAIGSMRYRKLHDLPAFGHQRAVATATPFDISASPLIDMGTDRDDDGNLVLTQIELLVYVWLPLALVNTQKTQIKYMSFALMLYQTVIRSHGSQTHAALALLLLKLLWAQNRFSEIARLLQLKFFPDAPEIAIFALDLSGAIDAAQQQHSNEKRGQGGDDDSDPTQWFISGCRGLESVTATLKQVALDMLWRLDEQPLVVRWLLTNGKCFDAISICNKKKGNWKGGLPRGSVPGIEFYKACVSHISATDSEGKFTVPYAQRVTKFFSLNLFLTDWEPELLKPDPQSSKLESQLAGLSHFPPEGVFNDKDSRKFRDIFGFSALKKKGR